MKKIWILCASNLREGKGQAVTFLVIIILASFLLNIGLLSYFNYNKNFDNKAKELNAADAMLVMQNKEPELIEKFTEQMKNDSRTAEFEKRSVLCSNGEFYYSGGKMKKIILALNASDVINIGKVAYVEKAEEKFDKPIYLPWLFHTGGGYNIGDDYTVTLSAPDGIEKESSYKVAGFYEETYLATIYSTTTGIILEPEEYRELSDSFQGTIDGTLFMSKLTDSVDGEKYVTKYLTNLKKELSPTMVSDSNFLNMMKQSRTITSSIGAMIIVAFAMIIVIVALIIVKFRIDNHIEEEMQNLGALKAIGYTSKQIMASILMQFSLISAIGSILGTFLSYSGLPFLSMMFAAQTGIVWKQGFDIVSALLTTFCILLTVLLVSLKSASKIQRLHPIVALRGGIATHSFKWNPFPLSRIKGNLILSLSGKMFLQNKKQNIMVGIIIAFISFAAVFSGVLYYNISVEDKFFLLTAGENMNVLLYTDSEHNAKEISLMAQNMTQVDKVLYYDTINLCNDEDGSSIIGYVTEDFSKLSNKNMIYKGRFPKHDNEIAIGGLLSKELKKNIGDTIRISVDNRAEEYLISGLLQSSNYLGRDACLTIEGYNQLVPDYWLNTISVYLRDGMDGDDFIEEVKKIQGDKIIGTANYKKLIEISMGVYKKVVSILVWIILFITAMVVILTLYLVVKTHLLHKKKEMGIQKAVGFTTRQLIVQTAYGFVPMLVLGTLVGCIAGNLGINPILSKLFSGIGIMKVNFVILPVLLIGLCIGITLTGFLTVVLVSIRIRKITPYTLMKE